MIFYINLVPILSFKIFSTDLMVSFKIFSTYPIGPFIIFAASVFPKRTIKSVNKVQVYQRIPLPDHILIRNRKRCNQVKKTHIYCCTDIQVTFYSILKDFLYNFFLIFIININPRINFTLESEYVTKLTLWISQLHGYNNSS